MHMNRRPDARKRTEAGHDLREADALRSSRKPERRATRRYLIDAKLEYRITRQQTVLDQGHGQTINISSSGVLFECQGPLPLGRKVEVSILWPAPPDSTQHVELFAEGRIVRADRNMAAIHIIRYAFRQPGDRNRVEF